MVVLQRDGNRWCALYGEDLQSGLAGFGEDHFLAIHELYCNHPETKGLPVLFRDIPPGYPTTQIPLLSRVRIALWDVVLRLRGV